MKKQISYQLRKIRQNNFAFNNKFRGGSNVPEINFNIQQSFEFQSEEKQLNITLLVNLIEAKTKNLLASLEIGYDYYIQEYEELTQTNEIPVSFLAVLLGLSLSSTRGILFSKTAGTILENYYLPILNPTGIIHNLINSNKQDDLIALANIHSGLKNYEIALEIIDRILRENPEDVTPHYNKAVIYNLMNDFEKSIEEYSLFIRRKKDFHLAYFGRAMSYFSLKEFEKATKDLNKVIELEPNDYLSYLNLGVEHLKREDLAKALKYFELSAEKNSNNYQAYNNIADVYRKMRKLDLALESSFKSLAINPNFNLAYATLAEIYAEQNNESLFYKNLEIALGLGYDLKKYVEDKVYDKYKSSGKFQNLLKKYKIEI